MCNIVPLLAGVDHVLGRDRVHGHQGPAPDPALDHVQDRNRQDPGLAHVPDREEKVEKDQEAAQRSCRDHGRALDHVLDRLSTITRTTVVHGREVAANHRSPTRGAREV